MGGDEFAVPAAPGQEPESERLTNADFRKIMMTPRAGSGATPNFGGATPYGGETPGHKRDANKKKDPNKAAERRKKKNYYAKIKREEDDKMKELASKYVDRAAMRRDGGESTQAQEEEATPAAGYRAMAPTTQGSEDQAARRRQMIQESKYLGGDMEHTHLVKGLDFALLQKVRSEISAREAELETLDAEGEAGDAIAAAAAKKKEEAAAAEKEEEERQKKEDETLKIETRTILAKNIVRQVFKPEIPKTNELFFPGRMAYIMELEEETESDIPTTTIRSKKDVAINEQKATLSTNDIVINKLTQILSYLRAGSRNKKKKKDRLVGMLDGTANIKTEKGGEDLPIYDELDYKSTAIKEEKRDRDRRRDDRDRHGDRRDDRRDDHRDRDYDRRDRDRRDRDRDRDRGRDRRPDDRHRGAEEKNRDERRNRDEFTATKRSYFDAPAVEEEEEEKEHRGGFSAEDKKLIKNLMRKEEEKEKSKSEAATGSLMAADNGYAECYPGMAEMEDGIVDSDEETDFSKMDMGNKKGPVGRWDFDTQEEYSDYMSNREAMPKAAFQYGMKMADGRKTRGKLGQKNEKAKLDKEWNQISALIEKRKGGGGGGSSSKKPKTS